jgi:hypothetical protein
MMDLTMPVLKTLKRDVKGEFKQLKSDMKGILKRMRNGDTLTIPSSQRMGIDLKTLSVEDFFTAFE